MCDESIFQCHLCSRTYTRNSTLQDHIKSHSEELKCPICGAHFSGYQAFKRHTSKKTCSSDRLASLGTPRAAPYTAQPPRTRTTNISTPASISLNTEFTELDNLINGSPIAMLSAFLHPLAPKKLRAQLVKFLEQILFKGQPVNEANLEFSCNLAIDWFSIRLYHVRLYEKKYDSEQSMLNVLRVMWYSIVEHLRDCSDATLYYKRVAKICEKLMARLYSVLMICVDNERESADSFWIILKQLLIHAIKINFCDPARAFLLLLMSTNVSHKTDFDDAEQFITYIANESYCEVKSEGKEIMYFGTRDNNGTDVLPEKSTQDPEGDPLERSSPTP